MGQESWRNSWLLERFYFYPAAVQVGGAGDTLQWDAVLRGVVQMPSMHRGTGKGSVSCSSVWGKLSCFL